LLQETTMTAQSDKARDFLALHQAKRGFVMPNPWDRGSARIMAHHDFKALATSSAAHANTLGRGGDYQVTLAEALVHCREIAEATDLPVSADFENGFADEPEAVAANILAAAGTGIVGCSIEDFSGKPGQTLYPFELAVERVRLAVLAARRLHTPFLITARTEEMLHGPKNIAEAVRRLLAFETVGAHVVYATGLTAMAQVRQVIGQVRGTPVNVMATTTLNANDLLREGIKRVSLGPWLHRAAMHGLLDAISEVKTDGSFTFAANAPTGADLATLLK
jgi:2-methylisocitrate lyase-like PEP mutase family enzyme